MLCPNCHREINDDSRFCNYCGARFDEKYENTESIPEPKIIEVTRESEPEEKTKKPFNKKTAAIICVAVLIVAVLVVIVAVSFSKGGGYVKEPLTDAAGEKIHEGRGTVEMAVRETDDTVREILSDKSLLSRESILTEYTTLLNDLKTKNVSFSYIRYQNLPTDKLSSGSIASVVLPIIDKYVTSKDNATTENYGVGNSDKLPLKNNKAGCLLTNTALIKNAYCEILDKEKDRYRLVITLVDDKDPSPLPTDSVSSTGTVNTMFDPYDVGNEISSIASLALTNISFNYTDCTSEIVYNKKTGDVESIKQTMNIDVTANAAIMKLGARIVDTVEYSNIVCSE